MITTISAIGGLVGLAISIGLLAWQTRAVARQTGISNRIAGLPAINGVTAGLREVHLLFVSDPACVRTFMMVRHILTQAAARPCANGR